MSVSVERERTFTSAAATNSAWDSFLASVPGGDLVQSTAWAETKVAIGQRTRLTLCHHGDAIAGGAMSVASRVAPGVNVAYVARGPVVAPGVERTDLIFRSLVAQLVRDARASRCRFLIVQPPEHLEAADGWLASLAFAPRAPAVSPEATIRLDVTKSDDALLGAMSAMRRRNIRKALRAPIDISDSSDVDSFHRLHVASAERQGFAPRSLDYLRSQWRILRPAGHVSIVMARAEGRPVAALWLTTFGDTTTYRLPGWDAAAGGVANVNEALHWAAMQHARRAGCRYYDLGGFDRGAAVAILDGHEMDDAFRRSPSNFKLGFDQTPLILPQARWIVPDRWLRPLASPLVARVMPTARGSRLANRFRNG
jgi:lipid II:glycine glycyltransferase (peptidoglycan interpeptide bridge formation enzyme)